MATVLERTITIVAEQLGVDPKELTPEKKFVADLGADSLDSIEVIMALEDEFCIEIPDEDAAPLLTVQAMADYIATRHPS